MGAALKIDEWLRDEIFAPVLRPRSRLDLRGWMEENITIRPTESPEREGPYQGADTLPVAKLLWEFWTSPAWRELAVQKCSQSALTFHVLGLLTRVAAEDPRNFIYAIDSQTEVRNISRRYRHLLEDCPLTSEKIGDAENAGDITKTVFELPGMIGWFIGAGSAGPFANKAASIGIGDELNKHPQIPGEPPTTALLRARLKTIRNAKLFFYSTPTTEDGAITTEYESGSKHQYFVPCPHCGHMQFLKWEGFQFGHCKDLAGHWDLDRVLHETHYQCESCEGKIEESHKRQMVEAGEWRPTNFREEDDLLSPTGKRLVPNFSPDRMSAKLPEYYSFHSRSSWGQLALEWVQAQGKPGKIHEHVTDRQAEPFKNAPSEVSEERIWDLRGEYDRGCLPFVPCIAALISDVQGDVFKWTRVGFTHRGDMAVADWGQSLTAEELEEIADAEIYTPDGGKAVKCQRVLIDEGHRAYEIRKFCAPRFPRFIPCKGRGGIQVRHVTSTSEGKIDAGGLHTIPVIHFSDDDFKRELYIRRISKFDKKRADVYDQPRLWLPRQLEPNFVRELCGENLVKEKKFGLDKWVWKSSPPNDWGDCLKMGLVLWSLIGPLFDPANKQPAA